MTLSILAAHTVRRRLLPVRSAKDQVVVLGMPLSLCVWAGRFFPNCCEGFLSLVLFALLRKAVSWWASRALRSRGCVNLSRYVCICVCVCRIPADDTHVWTMLMQKFQLGPPNFDTQIYLMGGTVGDTQQRHTQIEDSPFWSVDVLYCVCRH